MTSGVRERAQLIAIVALVLLAVGGAIAMLGPAGEVAERRPAIPTEVLKVANEVAKQPSTLPPPPVDMADEVVAGRCGGHKPFTGTGSVIADNGVRMVVHLPDGYDGTTPLPTVVMFHRAFDNAERMVVEEAIATSEINDFVVLAFDSNRPTGWSKEEYQTSTVAVLWAHEEFCLDRSRLFIVGNDQGARITANLACMMPVSATAVTFDRSVRGCKPVVPTSRLRIYGLKDKNVPVKGGGSCSVIEGASSSAADIRRQWIKYMQCEGRTKRWGDYPSGTCELRECNGESVFGECALDSGHYWPNDPGPMIPTTPCKVDEPETAFPTMAAIWDFFDEHGHVMTDDELAKFQDE